ncbi:MAG: hypothetical protein K2G55_03200 [Lachnospiraceae bacterium]|nr:hypothetical protein [Lachnospiraceae bacterium]MDE7204084.1 hypothetical protein [Lachnospiraceae bacterium]
MRLIDADYFKEQIAAATLKENVEPKKGIALMELVDVQPTAYDVDKVISHTVQMIKNDGGHYIPMECCSMTNPRTSGGVSEIDDIELPCGADCGNECDKCIIQRIMDEYAEITQQAK